MDNHNSLNRLKLATTVKYLGIFSEKELEGSG